jgi:hypothetical protein
MTTIKLVEGVVGGFMPAVPRKQILIEIDGPTVTIEKHLKSTDEKAVDGYLTTKATLETTKIKAEIDSFVSSVRVLPTEQPLGSQDIYQQDISIFVESDGFRWANVPNQGCDIQESTVKPTQAQKDQFKAIVQKIHQLADSHC